MARVVDLNDLTKTLNSMRIEWGKRDALCANIVEQTMLTAKNMSYDLEEWTPMSAGPPRKDGKYLCCYQGKSVDTGYFINGHFRLYGENKDNLIIAWMPLPEPYKEED